MSLTQSVTRQLRDSCLLLSSLGSVAVLQCITGLDQNPKYVTQTRPRPGHHVQSGGPQHSSDEYRARRDFSVNNSKNQKHTARRSVYAANTPITSVREQRGNAADLRSDVVIWFKKKKRRRKACTLEGGCLRPGMEKTYWSPQRDGEFWGGNRIRQPHPRSKQGSQLVPCTL